MVLFALGECVRVWMGKHIYFVIFVTLFFLLCIPWLWVSLRWLFSCIRPCIFGVCGCDCSGLWTTQAVQTSTRWMQSWERRWWLSGLIYHRRLWTCWSLRTRVSCRGTDHSRHSGVCVCVRSPTHQEDSFFQSVSFTALHPLIRQIHHKHFTCSHTFNQITFCASIFSTKVYKLLEKNN